MEEFDFRPGDILSRICSRTPSYEVEPTAESRNRVVQPPKTIRFHVLTLQHRIHVECWNLDLVMAHAIDALI